MTNSGEASHRDPVPALRPVTVQQMLDCRTGGPGCMPDTARHQRWPGPGLQVGYIQKFITHYEVLLLIAALPSPAPTTTVTGWAARGAARQVAGQGGGRVRVGEEGSG